MVRSAPILPPQVQSGLMMLQPKIELVDVWIWHKPAVNCRAEHVCSARAFQTSTCSAIAKASSTPMPRYRTVLSILVCSSRSWTALRLPVRR